MNPTDTAPPALPSDTTPPPSATAPETFSAELIPWLQRYWFCLAAARSHYWLSFCRAARETKENLSEGFARLVTGLFCAAVLIVLALPILLWRCVLQPFFYAHFRGAHVSGIMKGQVQALIHQSGLVAAFAVLCLLSLPSCANRPLTPEERQGIADAESIAVSGALGFAAGGEAGAVAGGVGQAVANLERIQKQQNAKTAPKNPVAPVVPKK